MVFGTILQVGLFDSRLNCGYLDELGCLKLGREQTFVDLGDNMELSVIITEFFCKPFICSTVVLCINQYKTFTELTNVYNFRNARFVLEAQRYMPWL